MDISVKKNDVVRFVRMKKFKNGKCEVHYTINKKRLRRIFATENLADEFINELNKFIKGTRIRNTNTGIEIELFRAIYEALESQLNNDLISESTYYGNFNAASSILTDEEKRTKVNNVDQEFVLKIKKRLEKTKVGRKSSGAMFKSFKVILGKVNNYCNFKGYNNMSVDFKSLKTTVSPKKLESPYTIEDYKKIGKVFEESESKDVKRKAASILVNMQLGLRFGELACITKEDIDLVKKEVYVTKTVTLSKEKGRIIGKTTKNKKNRTVPIYGKTVKYLEFLLSFDSKFILDCDHGSRDNNLPITNATFRAWIKQISKLAGTRELSTHTAGRKTMATIVAQSMLDDGNDILKVANTVKDILGHKSTELTLDVYIKPAISEVKETFSAFK